jgi:hypothetical protein
VAGEQWLEWHWAAGAGSLSCFRNGESIGTAAYSGTRSVGSTTTLGKYRSALQHHLDAEVAEVIVYDRLLEASEAALVRRYLKERYGF